MKTKDTNKDIYTMLAIDAVINKLQNIVNDLESESRMNVSFLEENLESYCDVMLKILGIKLKIPKRNLQELKEGMQINFFLRNQYLDYFKKILSFFKKELIINN
jgi:hypothetical protein